MDQQNSCFFIKLFFF